MTRLLAKAAIAVVLTGCPGPKDEHRTGGISVTASPLANGGAIERITITASPGGHAATLARGDLEGQWIGTMILPVGAYTLEAAASGDANGDGVPELIGTGSAPVIVHEGRTTAVAIRILDVTGPPPLPDHAPIITSVTLSSPAAAVNEPLALSATAVDVDGHAIAWAWSETCSSGVPGTFSAPAASSTDWTPAAPGICALRLVVTANGLTDTVLLEVAVSGAEGGLEVTAYFFSHPYIAHWRVSGVDAAGAPFDVLIWRDGPDATLPYDVRVGAATRLEMTFGDYDYWRLYTYAITDDCGGAFAPASYDGGSLAGSWQAPAVPGVCLVSGSVARFDLEDTFPIAVNVVR